MTDFKRKDRGRFFEGAEVTFCARTHRGTRCVLLPPIKANCRAEPASKIGRGCRAEGARKISFPHLRSPCRLRAVCVPFAQFRGIFKDLRVICRSVGC
jgi:hypothetical protein